MQNSSIESYSQPLPLPENAGFRGSLIASDPGEIERLVTRAGVFNRDEIAVARNLADEAFALGDEETGYHFLLADGPKELDGYTCYGPIPGTERRFELYWIAVDAAQRRRGLARSLLLATEGQVRTRGGTHLFVETSTRDDYRPAHRLYASLGYRHFGIVPDYHADGDGLAIYGKRL